MNAQSFLEEDCEDIFCSTTEAIFSGLREKIENTLKLGIEGLVVTPGTEFLLLGELNCFS